jgi:Calcineurin-like phosphoesterase superfamily domain
MNQPHVIGVISDTHGLLRPEAVEALQGSELIIHAGDVGKPEILDELARTAPVVAIRGNVDAGIWAQGLPQTRTVEIDEVQERRQMDPDVLSRLCRQPSALAAICVGVQSGQLSAAGRAAPSGAAMDTDDVAEKLIKIGAKVVRQARQVIFQMAEVAIPRELFRTILERIGRLRLPTPEAG